MTSAQRKYCLRSRNWLKPARANGDVNEFYLWNETFSFGVLVAWPVNQEQMHQALKFHGCAAPEKEIRPLCSHGSKTVFDTDNGRYFIFFTEASRRRLSDMAHECFHVVCAALHQRGIKPDDEGGDETWAYLLGWMTSEVITVVLPLAIKHRPAKKPA